MRNIVKAEKRDLPDVLALLEETSLPVEGVAEHFHNFFVARDGDCIVGCAGIEVYQDVGLLRSVAVHPSSQRRGLGHELVEKTHEFAIRSGLEEIYLITVTAEKFFSTLNYASIPREDVDPKIKQSSEFTHVCPTSGVCMVRHL